MAVCVCKSGRGECRRNLTRPWRRAPGCVLARRCLRTLRVRLRRIFPPKCYAFLWCISRQSRDCLRGRVLRGCTAIRAPSALVPGISRGCTFACFGSRCASTPPPQIRLPLRCAIHPRMRLAWLGRDAPVALQRRLAAHVASQHRIRSGPVAVAPRPCTLFVAYPGSLVAAQASACALDEPSGSGAPAWHGADARLGMSHCRALRTNGFIPRVVGLVGQVRPV